MLTVLFATLTLLPRLADERPAMPVAGIVVLAVLTLARAARPPHGAQCNSEAGVG